MFSGVQTASTCLLMKSILVFWLAQLNVISKEIYLYNKTCTTLNNIWWWAGVQLLKMEIHKDILYQFVRPITSRIFFKYFGYLLVVSYKIISYKKMTIFFLIVLKIWQPEFPPTKLHHWLKVKLSTQRPRHRMQYWLHLHIWLIIMALFLTILRSKLLLLGLNTGHPN